MAKKASKKSTGSSASRSPAKADSGSSGDRLLGAVYFGGRMYDHRKASDQQAFKEAVANDKKLGDKNKDGSPRAQIDLQRLAEEGVIKGYGTRASAKGQRAAEKAEEDLDNLEDQDPNAEAGGGVDAVAEQEAMEQELEEQEEDR